MAAPAARNPARELRSRGYLGSKRTLTAQLRASTAQATPPPAPKVREVTGWIVTRPDKNTAEDLAKLRKINDRCPELASVIILTREFAEILVQLHGHDLDAWAERAEASPARELRAFATGLRRDWAAVKAGLTLPYSSGKVEGNVNRIFMWNLICQAMQVKRLLGCWIIGWLVRSGGFRLLAEGGLPSVARVRCR